jgi:tRNA nucleotidyltransferase/poly(A) polymerase
VGAQPLYLVGGAVRDLLLGVESYDLDFALPGDALRYARKVADALKAAYYPLDEQHPTGRVVWAQPEGRRILLDFAQFRGPDLESDLRARDFTVNAMAIDMRGQGSLIDPLGGGRDLRAGKLKACSSDAFERDPLRILRGVRLATGFEFQIARDTRLAMRAAAPLLGSVSPERQRDELFRILEGPRPHVALRALEVLDVLGELLPEIQQLKGLAQPAPHINEAWTHTLHTLRELERLLEMLGPTHDPEAAADFRSSLAVMRLGRYRTELAQHLDQAPNPARSGRGLLFLAGLYHDAAKPLTREKDESGRVRFFKHQELGAQLIHRRARQLRLSNQEIKLLAAIVRHHMRPLMLAQTARPPSRRAIYRFFRDTGPAGVDVCLLSLADTLATYGPTLPQETWIQHLEVVRALLEAWWERRPEQVAPPPLVNGHDLMDALQIESGPGLGRLLEYLREAQAGGEVQDREGAMALARRWLEDQA